MGVVWWIVLGLILAAVIAVAWLLYAKYTSPECDILNLYFANDSKETEYFRSHIYPKLKSHTSIKWYLAEYRDGVVRTVETNSTWVSPSEPESWFKSVFRANQFSALVYSGHSGGPYLGNEDNPMISVDKFVRTLRAATPELAFIWFDSCNMGFLQSLVLMNGVAKYVVGAPNYYDWQSVLQTREIYHLGRGDASELLSVIRSQASKYDGDAEVLVELCVYRPDRLNTLWLLYKQYRRQLVHDDESQIEDDYYDIADMIRASAGKVDPSVLAHMQKSLDEGVVARDRCRDCALEVRDSTLAVQKNRDLDGNLLTN